MARPDLLAVVLIVVGAIVFVGLSSLVADPVQARSSGIVNHSGNPDAGGGVTCTECHGGAAAEPSVTIDVPAQVTGGEAVDVTVTIQGGPGVVGGFNASVLGFAGELIADDIETYIDSNQITHTAPKPFGQGEVAFTFEWVPPVQPGENVLFAAGLSANQSNNPQGDGTGTATVFVDVLVGDVLGDVSCNGVVDIIDALFISQFTAGIRADVAACPMNDPAAELVVARGDVNGNQVTDIIDALFIAQCTAGIANVFCPV